MNDLLKFTDNSALTSYDEAIATTVRNVVPKIVAGKQTFSTSSVTAPNSTAITATGLVSPSSGINNVGNSFSYVIQGNFGFTATGAAITIYWDGTNGSVPFVVRRASGNPITIPSGSITIAALSPSTSYQFAPFVSVAQPQRVSFVMGDSGIPKYGFSPSVSPDFIALASQTQRLTVNESITSGFISYTTPASGSSNSGTGTGTYVGRPS